MKRIKQSFDGGIDRHSWAKRQKNDDHNYSQKGFEGFCCKDDNEITTSRNGNPLSSEKNDIEKDNAELEPNIKCEPHTNPGLNLTIIPFDLDNTALSFQATPEDYTVNDLGAVQEEPGKDNRNSKGKGTVMQADCPYARKVYTHAKDNFDLYGRVSGCEIKVDGLPESAFTSIEQSHLGLNERNTFFSEGKLMTGNDCQQPDDTVKTTAAGELEVQTEIDSERYYSKAQYGTELRLEDIHGPRTASHSIPEDSIQRRCFAKRQLMKSDNSTSSVRSTSSEEGQTVFRSRNGVKRASRAKPLRRWNSKDSTSSIRSTSTEEDRIGYKSRSSVERRSDDICKGNAPFNNGFTDTDSEIDNVRLILADLEDSCLENSREEYVRRYVTEGTVRISSSDAQIVPTDSDHEMLDCDMAQNRNRLYLPDLGKQLATKWQGPKEIVDTVSTGAHVAWDDEGSDEDNGDVRGRQLYHSCPKHEELTEHVEEQGEETTVQTSDNKVANTGFNCQPNGDCIVNEIGNHACLEVPDKCADFENDFISAQSDCHTCLEDGEASECGQSEDNIKTHSTDASTLYNCKENKIDGSAVPESLNNRYLELDEFNGHQEQLLKDGSVDMAHVEVPDRATDVDPPVVVELIDRPSLTDVYEQYMKRRGPVQVLHFESDYTETNLDSDINDYSVPDLENRPAPDLEVLKEHNFQLPKDNSVQTTHTEDRVLNTEFDQPVLVEVINSASLEDVYDQYLKRQGAHEHVQNISPEGPVPQFDMARDTDGYVRDSFVSQPSPDDFTDIEQSNTYETETKLPSGVQEEQAGVDSPIDGCVAFEQANRESSPSEEEDEERFEWQSDGGSFETLSTETSVLGADIEGSSDDCIELDLTGLEEGIEDVDEGNFDILSIESDSSGTNSAKKRNNCAELENLDLPVFSEVVIGEEANEVDGALFGESDADHLPWLGAEEILETGFVETRLTDTDKETETDECTDHEEMEDHCFEDYDEHDLPRQRAEDTAKSIPSETTIVDTLTDTETDDDLIMFESGETGGNCLPRFSEENVERQNCEGTEMVQTLNTGNTETKVGGPDLDEQNAYCISPVCQITTDDRLVKGNGNNERTVKEADKFGFSVNLNPEMLVFILRDPTLSPGLRYRLRNTNAAYFDFLETTESICNELKGDCILPALNPKQKSHTSKFALKFMTLFYRILDLHHSNALGAQADINALASKYRHMHMLKYSEYYTPRKVKNSVETSDEGEDADSQEEENGATTGIRVGELSEHDSIDYQRNDVETKVFDEGDGRETQTMVKPLTEKDDDKRKNIERKITIKDYLAKRKHGIRKDINDEAETKAARCLEGENKQNCIELKHGQRNKRLEVKHDEQQVLDGLDDLSPVAIESRLKNVCKNFERVCAELFVVSGCAKVFSFLATEGLMLLPHLGAGTQRFTEEDRADTLPAVQIGVYTLSTLNFFCTTRNDLVTAHLKNVGGLLAAMVRRLDYWYQGHVDGSLRDFENVLLFGSLALLFNLSQNDCVLDYLKAAKARTILDKYLTESAVTEIKVVAALLLSRVLTYKEAAVYDLPADVTASLQSAMLGGKDVFTFRAMYGFHTKDYLFIDSMLKFPHHSTMKAT